MPTRVSSDDAAQGEAPFEVRYQEALRSLHQLSALIQRLSTNSLRFRQAQSKKKEGVLSKFLASSLKNEEGHYATLWRDGLQISTQLHGSDATHFALKALQTEHNRN